MSFETPEMEKTARIIVQSVEEGKEFVFEQASEIIQQVVMYHRCAYTLEFIIAAVLTILACLLTFYGVLKMQLSQGKNDLCMVVGGSLTLVLSMFSVTVGVKTLAWWIMPKACVLQWAIALTAGT